MRESGCSRTGSRGPCACVLDTAAGSHGSTRLCGGGQGQAAGQQAQPGSAQNLKTVFYNKALHMHTYC